MKTIEKLIMRAKEERGKWLATATGNIYFLENQNPRNISVVDIAFGLARKCRYSGNIRLDRTFYSVAEHSDLMAQEFERNPSYFLGDEPMMLEDYLKMKFHDATEFVFPDVPTPLKDMFPMFRTIEGYHDEKIESAIIPNPSGVMLTKKQVKEFDVRIRADERKHLIAEPAYSAGLGENRVEPLGVEIKCHEWHQAGWNFLEDFVRAVETYPARLPENQKRADQQKAWAVQFLNNNPRPVSREVLMKTLSQQEEEVSAMRAEMEMLRADKQRLEDKENPWLEMSSP